MTEYKYTPGPWTVNEVPIQSSGGSNKCFKILPIRACIYDDWKPRERGVEYEENKANAKLIAAAPDMLEYLKLIKSANGLWGTPHDLKDVPEDQRGELEALIAMENGLDSIIKRAE